MPLARALFFNRLGEMRDRSFENQRCRASGLNLVVAAIILWNTVYLKRATGNTRKHDRNNSGPSGRPDEFRGSATAGSTD
jgi:TnpA family transposase